ncbi:flippase [Gracilibacillus suaedae]|uniref:flippase n=1 Tax=Gracilibacillus suaedae TaxID=2820273 RepID=UPI001ABDA815|nr:flippase [Gracilibacillus suaedae]
MNRELKNVTKQSGIVFVGKLIGLVITFLFNLIVARLLGAEVFGEFTYLYTFISFFPIIALLGIQQGLVYYIPKLSEEKEHKIKREFITISYLIVSISSILLVVIIIVNSELISKHLLNDSNLSTTLRLIAPMIILLTLVQLSQGVFRGIKEIKPFIINQNLIVPSFKVIFFIVAVSIISYNINSIILSFYLSIGIGVIYLLYYIYSSLLFGKFAFNSIILYKKVLIYSLPLLLTGFLGFISQKTDIFMIGYYLNNENVGIYRVALQIGTISSFVLVAFNMIFAPTISSLFNRGDMNKLSYMFKTITKWVVTINLIAFGLIVLNSAEIMSVFGEEFVSGNVALILISIGQVVNVGVGSSGYMLIMTGFPKYEMYNNFLTVSINVILNLILIPKYGIEGAAIASLASVSIANITRLLMVYKIHEIHPYSKDYLKIFSVITLSYLMCVFLKQIINFNIYIDLILYTMLFTILSGSILYILGVSKEDKQLIHMFIRKIKKSSNNG